jgi:putative DNA primase/helicase
MKKAVGLAPVWAATSASAIERFPVLGGVESLTIFADDDEAGMRAAFACAESWIKAGCEATILPPPDRGQS